MSSSRWPSRKQWRQFLKILDKKEKRYFFVFASLFLISFTYLATTFYLDKTKVVPADGGTYVEGIIGSPRFINPLYAVTSDVDRDLSEIIFSGLVKYDSEGNIKPDLAKNYEILENGMVYEFELKENVLWHDSQPFTADDVVFTVEAIQNSEVKSPLRPMWLGVKVEKVSDFDIRFRLKNASSVFLENCTLKIIPKHIWEEILPKNFLLSQSNLKPIGTGPYMLDLLSKDNKGNIISLDLIKNTSYFEKPPYLSKISFRFFEEKEKEKAEKNMVNAYNVGDIEGFSLNSMSQIPREGNVHIFTIPRYFTVFLNPQASKALSEKEIRAALNHGTDKKEILNIVFSGQGKEVNSPILPNVYGFKVQETVYDYDPETAKDLLGDAKFFTREDGFREKTVIKTSSFSFKSSLSVSSQGAEVTELQKCLTRDPEVYPEGDITGYFGPKTKSAVIRFQEKYSQDILEPFGLTTGTGAVKGKTRDKLNEVCFDNSDEIIPLKFTLHTAKDPLLEQTAQILKTQWKEIGVDLDIETFNIATIEGEIIRKREYEILLFGEALGSIPDPFPFWHSSQKGELGLNLANYENKKADTLLEENRESLEEDERKEKLEEFQNILVDDCPVVFLFNPDYRYLVSEKIKGINQGLIIDPSKRFVDIGNWYVRTKRVIK